MSDNNNAAATQQTANDLWMDSLMLMHSKTYDADDDDNNDEIDDEWLSVTVCRKFAKLHRPTDS